MIIRLRNRSRQRGIAAVEFALVAPVVLVIVFAIFEFGFAFWRKQSLTAAVRAGAREAILATNPRKTLSEVQTEVTTYMDGVGLTDSGRTVGCTGCPCPTSGDADVTVTATYPTNFTVLSALKYGGGMAASKTLNASVVMKCEAP